MNVATDHAKQLIAWRDPRLGFFVEHRQRLAVHSGSPDRISVGEGRSVRLGREFHK